MRVVSRPSERSDIIEQADYLEQVADLDVAERFLDAVQSSLEQLAQMPFLGSPLHFINPVLAGHAGGQ
jgi:plasmid stabilization system protein ParE